MQASILIVSKNRKEELLQTLKIVESLIDKTEIEVIVFLDGCIDGSECLQNELNWVKWHISLKSIGASAARHQIYPLAKSEILIGLDDDAHPLNQDFIRAVKELFDENSNVGVLAFEEIRGVFTSDEEALSEGDSRKKEYLGSVICLKIT